MAGKRGFAAMDKEAQRVIASKGGRAAHARGTAHEFNSQEAAEAGRKGGRTVSRDRRHMAEIGRKGGKAAHSQGPTVPAPANGEPLSAASQMPAPAAQLPAAAPSCPMPAGNGQGQAPNAPMQAPSSQSAGPGGQMPMHGTESMPAGV